MPKAIGQNYTKSQAKRAMVDIEKKAKKLFFDGYITTKDLEAMLKILDLRYKKI